MSKEKQPENLQDQETEIKEDPVVDVQALTKELEEKNAQCKEYLDRYQRLAAEFDNFRKRTIKEREQISIDAVADTIEKLLPVLDNLDRAMEAISNEPDSSIKQGFELVSRQLLESFDKIGISHIPAFGEVFDPNVHDAVMHIQDEEKGESIIVEEFQKGYIYKEKVIRHSMVKVAN